jgi:hypothetical protein
LAPVHRHIGINQFHQLFAECLGVLDLLAAVEQILCKRIIAQSALAALDAGVLPGVAGDWVWMIVMLRFAAYSRSVLPISSGPLSPRRLCGIRHQLDNLIQGSDDTLEARRK